LSINSVLFIALNDEVNSHIGEKLRAADISIKEVNSFPAAHEELLSEKYGICVNRSDLLSEGLFELMRFIKMHKIPTKIIISLKSGTVEDAVRIMKAGASDVIIGDSSDPRLLESILRTATDYRQSATNAHIDPSSADSKAALVGQSQAICEIRSAINLVAKSPTTVLITGESGTGKEVVAHLIHLQSNRADKQFIALNCATLPKDVIENELFGHERGAFTGALLKKQGCFEIAHGGTLLFDEIAEMSLDTQAKLLRVIETQKFRRLGGKDEVHVDVRMIAATNKNITTALKLRELREDLYYRLSVIEIFIPPVRERKEDIGMLVEYFLAFFAMKYNKPLQHFSEESLDLLNTYNWPGNVREIRNVVERSLVICPHECIDSKYVPDRIQKHIAPRHIINIPLGCSAEEAERILILQTLASAGNNKAKTAKILGVSRKTLHNKLSNFSQS